MFNFDFLQWLFCLGQVTLIAGMILIAGRLLIRHSPDVASLVSALAMVAGCLLVVTTGLDIPKPWSIQSSDDIAVSTSIVKPPVGSQVTTADALSAGDRGLSVLSFSTHDLFARLKPFLSDPTTVQHRLGKITFHFAVLCCVLLGIRLSFGVMALVALRWGSRPMENHSLQDQLECFQNRLQLKKQISIRGCSGIESPCVSWLSPSVIFVPREFESWTQAEQESSLAHELGHIKRSDPLWRLTSELAWTFVCWHPMMWKVRQQLVLAQEMSADQLAVHAQGSRKSYQKGLSLLALRLDSPIGRKKQNIYFLGTSVSSSSLIRRIKMLQGLKTNEIKSSVVKRGLAIVTSLMVFGWLSCWSADALTTQQESDESTQPPVVRVAKNTAPPPLARAPFTRKIPTPWTSLGKAKGYLSVRVSDLLEHPIHSKTLPVMWDQIPCLKKKADGTPQTLSDAGLPLNSITTVQSSVELFYSKRTEERNDANAHLHSVAWGVGGAGVVVRTNKDVNWPNLVGDLDLSLFSASDELKNAGKMLAESATVGSEFRVPGEVLTQQPTKGDVKPVASLTREIEGELWSFVSGGVVTIMSDVSVLNGIEAGDGKKLDEFQELATMTSHMLQTVAIGIDIGDENAEEFRVAVEPFEGTSVEALSDKIQQLINRVANEMEADDEPHGAQAMRKMEVRVQETDSGSFVTVTGRLPLLYLYSTNLDHY